MEITCGHAWAVVVHNHLSMININLTSFIDQYSIVLLPDRIQVSGKQPYIIGHN